MKKTVTTETRNYRFLISSSVVIVGAVVMSTILIIEFAYLVPSPYNYFAALGAIPLIVTLLKALFWMDQFERYWCAEDYPAWAIKH